MDSNPASSGDLAEDRQRALELRRVGDLYAIDESRDEVICVFEGVADIVQTFYQFVKTLVVVMRGAI
jgi:hypothetical protein